MNRRQTFSLSLTLLALTACTHPRPNPYESSSRDEQAGFKQVMIPLPVGTHYVISQGAFGKNTHHDRGHEYTWDFDVPYGTPVLSIDDGTVIQVYEPTEGGGCDAKYGDFAHNIKVRHRDGTVAQYVHIRAIARYGERVRKGQKIAVTAENGFVCTPQLDFGVYADERHLMGSGDPKSIPLRFEGIGADGIAREGLSGKVPNATPTGFR
jgi:murein DD-endopeptidase MepM/ murein hydrolase activator NlpD